MKLLALKLLVSLLLVSVSLPDDRIQIGIDEKLGNRIPLNITFNDELGNPVQLKELVTKPTVLALVYYHCPGMCNPLMFELSNVMNKSSLEPGYDYNVVSISFDENENPEVALNKKKEMFSGFEKEISEDSWRFLTGSKENIEKITDAAGFYFKRDGKEFRHASALIFLDKNGKICRYLFPGYTENHGFGILPFDFKMAILETSESKEIPTISRMLRFCFSYNPDSESYVLNFTRISGLLILLFVGIFLVIMKFKPRKEKIK